MYKQVHFVIGVLEVISLLGLSIVSSQEQFDIHKVCFGSFIAFAFIYMCLSIYLFEYCGFDIRRSPVGFTGMKCERKSLHFKWLIVRSSFFMILVMIFFYWYHNTSCKPYVYTVFCLSEYLVVLLNMGFHGCAYYDFYGHSVNLSSVSLRHEPLKHEPDEESQQHLINEADNNFL